MQNKSAFPFRLFALLSIAAALCLFTACPSPSSDGDDTTDEVVLDVVIPAFSDTTPYSGTSSFVTKVDFGSDSTKIVNLTGLTGQDVVLVKMNAGSSVAPKASTGGVASSSLTAPNGSVSSLPIGLISSRSAVPASVIPDSRAISGVSKDGYVRYDHEGAREFSRNPPAFTPPASRSASVSASASLSGSVSPLSADTGVAAGDQKQFWVENASGAWIQINATLQAVGTSCYVWVADANYFDTSSSDSDNKITTAEAEDLAEKFDAIYPLETNLLGYEYGGGLASTDATYGGIDGDTKVSILVYDLGFDYAASQTSGMFGYFWGKDEYTDAEMNASYGMRSNESEIFYVDSHFTDCYAEGIYSTLVHEFQHMINFNRKSIKSKMNPATWYNEMLSLVAEDLVSPLIGLTSDSALPAKSRIPLFTGVYDWAGITEWDTNSVNYSVLVNYSNAYAFGAYLARNYGGAALIRAMEQNGSIDIGSVSSALAEINPSEFTFGTGNASSAFLTAFGRYGEAFVYSGSNVDTTYADLNSFDRTVTTAINDTDYTCSAFDIWDVDNYFAGYYSVPAGTKGPLVYDISQYALAAYGLTLQSSDSWQNLTGSLSVTLTKPSDADVTLYLMIR